MAQYRLQQLAEQLDAQLIGDPDQLITGIATLEAAQPHQISFLANPAYQKYLPNTQAGAVLLKEAFIAECPCSALVLPNPYLAYAHLSQLFDPMAQQVAGIHPTACISASAQVDSRAQIGAHVVIEAGATVGAYSSIGANSYVGADTRIGERCRIYPNVTLYHGVTIGQQVTIHSGCVIGGDGFGFANDRGRWVKIAQLGGVVIGDHVEIGANTNIDRGALDDTQIASYVIIDSQVQIAHNVKVGEGTAIAGCVGIAGSAEIGRNCLIGGASNISGHLQICDGVMLNMTTNVTRSITQPGAYSSGTGLMEIKAWRKNAVRFSQLDQLAKRIKVLEQAVAAQQSDD